MERTSYEYKQITANTIRQQAETIRVLVESGFEKKVAVKAVTGNDLSLLS